MGLKTDLIHNEPIAPGVNDDSSNGYSVGDEWKVDGSDVLYECIDSSVGAAVWANKTVALSKSEFDRALVIAMGGGNNSFVQSTSTTYATLTTFHFPGTDILGLIKKINAVFWRQNAVSASLRIYDVTNAQVICELTGVTDTVPNSQDMGAINNLPSAPALFEIQGLRTGNAPGVDRVRCAGATFEY